MKKILIATTCLLALAACDTCHAPSASAQQTCSERGLAKGTTAYQHCIVVEQRAANLDSENRALVK